MNNQSALITALQEAFSDRLSKECLDSIRTISFVVYEDHNNRSRFYIPDTNDDKIGFRIKNPKGKLIYLLAVDQCFFGDDEIKRCDCIIFDDQSFCFVELKLDAKRRRATANVKEARVQLGETINFFKTALLPKSNNFFGFTLEAYVVMKTQIYPRHPAGLVQRRVKFLEDFGVRLFEENSRTFL